MKQEKGQKELLKGNKKEYLKVKIGLAVEVLAVLKIWLFQKNPI
jgi:hypothetical protein